MGNKSNRFTDFYNAYIFLKEHKMVNKLNKKYHMVNGFEDSLYVTVVKVNPLTEKIEDNQNLNTETRVWLEFGPLEFNDKGYFDKVHDTRLDCGGETFEEAIINLANLVDYYYDDKTGVDRVNKDIEEANISTSQFFNKEKNWILNWSRILDKYDNEIKSEYDIIDLSNHRIIKMDPCDIWDINWEEIE